MNPGASRPWRLIVGALVLAALAAATSREIHGLRRDQRAGGELMYFPSGYLLRPMALGHLPPSPTACGSVRSSTTASIG
jgi:hypothetical protein